MNHLIEIRTNILYNKRKDKKGNDVFNKFHELIFLVTKPKYTKTTDGAILRESKIKKFKFSVSDANYDIMLRHLKALKNIEDEDMV
jgi:hypothetical protein